MTKIKSLLFFNQKLIKISLTIITIIFLITLPFTSCAFESVGGYHNYPNVNYSSYETITDNNVVIGTNITTGTNSGYWVIISSSACLYGSGTARMVIYNSTGYIMFYSNISSFSSFVTGVWVNFTFPIGATLHDNTWYVISIICNKTYELFSYNTNTNLPKINMTTNNYLDPLSYQPLIFSSTGLTGREIFINVYSTSVPTYLRYTDIPIPTSTPTPIPTPTPTGLAILINTIVDLWNTYKVYIGILFIAIFSIVCAYFAGTWGMFGGLNCSWIIVYLFGLMPFWTLIFLGIIDAVLLFANTGIMTRNKNGAI